MLSPVLQSAYDTKGNWIAKSNSIPPMHAAAVARSLCTLTQAIITIDAGDP